MLLGITLGVWIGHVISAKVGLIFMCIINASVLSMVVYSFLISFTGTWIVLISSFIIFTTTCTILPLKFEN